VTVCAEAVLSIDADATDATAMDNLAAERMVGDAAEAATMTTCNEQRFSMLLMDI